jgi:hypothetical protein
MNTELIARASTEIAEYNPVEAGLAELRRKYLNVVVDVSTPRALADARRARSEIREPRYETEKIRKMLKAPALAHARLIDTEAARITAALLEIETPWDQAIKVEEERLAAEREARAAAERARVVSVHARISEIKEVVIRALECRSAAQVEGLLGELARSSLMGFDEFGDEAAAALAATMKRVEAILVEKHLEEQKQAQIQADLQAQTQRLAAERAELALQRAQAHTPVPTPVPTPAAPRPATKQKVAAEDLAPVLQMPTDDQSSDAPPSASQIISVVADYFGVTRAQVVDWLRSDAFLAALQ